MAGAFTRDGRGHRKVAFCIRDVHGPFPSVHRSVSSDRGPEYYHHRRGGGVRVRRGGNREPFPAGKRLGRSEA